MSTLGLLCIKSSSSVVELVMLLCSQVRPWSSARCIHYYTHLMCLKWRVGGVGWVMVKERTLPSLIFLEHLSLLAVPVAIVTIKTKCKIRPL